MAEPEGMAESCIGSFKARPRKVLLVGVQTEPEQRDDTGFSTWLGNAKDEVQVIGKGPRR